MIYEQNQLGEEANIVASMNHAGELGEDNRYITAKIICVL